MHCNGADADLLEHFCKLHGVDTALVPAAAHFRRDGHPDGAHDRLGDARGLFYVAHQGAAVTIFHDLAHRAAHVDVQNVRAGDLNRHLRGLGHAGFVAAEDLRGKGLFAGKRTQELRGFCVVIAQRLGAHKLGDGVACAKLGADLTECSICHARHRRERQLRFNFYSSDLHSPPLFDNNTSIV